MKLPRWLKLGYRQKAALQMSRTACPTCGKEMIQVDKYTMMGDDMRTYRCDHCQKEHILDFGPAMWQLMSDANKSEE